MSVGELKLHSHSESLVCLFVDSLSTLYVIIYLGVVSVSEIEESSDSVLFTGSSCK